MVTTLNREDQENEFGTKTALNKRDKNQVYYISITMCWLTDLPK